MRSSSFLLPFVLPALLLLGACRAEPVDPSGNPRSGNPRAARLTGDQEADRATLQRLDGEAADIARTDGCSSAAECRSAPVGVRACGGPRHYLPYCPATTDEAALNRKLAEIEEFERAFNERYRIVSTCEYRMPPQLELSGGACRAVTPTLRDGQ
ncbi:MAG TPA: hypothetical protein VGE02_16940 [Gemmatimonadales bacterium]